MYATSTRTPSSTSQHSYSGREPSSCLSPVPLLANVPPDVSWSAVAATASQPVDWTRLRPAKPARGCKRPPKAPDSISVRPSHWHRHHSAFTPTNCPPPVYVFGHQACDTRLLRYAFSFCLYVYQKSLCHQELD